ncbi:MAG: translation elongation factor Ts, partial [Erysipelotrichales bacterium]|nr:translation elongation factor Ts [Erysipelotrichales bacterium]
MMDCKKALDSSNGDIEAAIDWLREKGIAKAAKKEGRIAAEGLTAIAVKDNKASMVEVNVETDFASKNEKFQKLVVDIANTVVNSNSRDLESSLQAKMGSISVADAIVQAVSVIGEKITLRRVITLEKTNQDVFGTYVHMGGKIGVIVTLKGTNDEIVAKDVAMHVAASAPQYLNKQDVDQDYIEKETHIQLEAAKVDPKLQGKPEEALKNIVKGKVDKSLREICLSEQPFVKDPSVTIAQFVKNHGAEIVEFVRFKVGEGIEKREDNFAEEVMNQVRK